MVQDFVYQYVPLPSWGLKWSNDLDDLGAQRPVAVAEERFVVLGVVRSPPPPPPAGAAMAAMACAEGTVPGREKGKK